MTQTKPKAPSRGPAVRTRVIQWRASHGRARVSHTLQLLQHAGSPAAVGQAANRILADVVYDRFVAREQSESAGDLLVRYQAPLIAGDDVFMEFQAGTQIARVNPFSSTLGPTLDSNTFVAGN